MRILLMYLRYLREPKQKRTDFENIEVFISHPFVDFSISLKGWMERGPGPRRFVHPFEPFDKVTKEKLPHWVIPLEYRNNRLSRWLIARGRLVNPWPDKEKHG